MYSIEFSALSAVIFFPPQSNQSMVDIDTAAARLRLVQSRGRINFRINMRVNFYASPCARAAIKERRIFL